MQLTHPGRRRSTGFTVFEILLALIVLGVIWTTILNYEVGRVQTVVVERTVSDYSALAAASYAYYALLDRWPADTIELAGRNLVPNATVLNGAGNLMELDTVDIDISGLPPPPPLVTPQVLEITSGLRSLAQATDIQSRLGSSAIIPVGSNNVTLRLAPPIYETDLAGFLRHDGSRPMSGNLNMNGENIIRISRARARTLQVVGGVLTVTNAPTTFNNSNINLDSDSSLAMTGGTGSLTMHGDRLEMVGSVLTLRAGASVEMGDGNINGVGTMNANNIQADRVGSALVFSDTLTTGNLIAGDTRIGTPGTPATVVVQGAITAGSVTVTAGP